MEWIEKYLGDQQSLLVEVSEAVSRENVPREDGTAGLGSTAAFLPGHCEMS